MSVSVGDVKTTARIFRHDRGGGRRLLLAHGAGADQRHPFMVEVAEGLAARGVEVVTFNFLYTEAGRRAPDRTPLLEACWRAVLARFGPAFIGGKSMGGRIASHLAAAGDPGIFGLVFLGYPLHPPDKPDKRRDAHLPSIRQPMLFVQGARDPFGGEDEIRPLAKRLSAQLHLAAGDHSPKLDDALLDAVAAFISGTTTPPPPARGGG